MRTAVASRFRPLYKALGLAAGVMVLTLTVAYVLGWLTPELDLLHRRLIAVLVLAVSAAGVVLAKDRTILSSGGVEPRLLIIPGIIVLSPFAGGVKDLGFETGSLLVAGYLATGVYEELWFRGMILKSLHTWTPLRSACLSSALFGSAHLSNLAFGADPLVTAAQVIGAACFGFGLAALRLRGTTLWPLVILHAVGDIALQFGNITSAWRWTNMIVSDTCMLIFGLIILRASTGRRNDPGIT